jgi:hypothetical protein
MSQYSLKQAISLIAKRTGAEVSDAKATITELYPHQTQFTEDNLADIQSIYQEAVSIADQQGGGGYWDRDEAITQIAKSTGASPDVIDNLIAERYGSVALLNSNDANQLIDELAGNPQH